MKTDRVRRSLGPHCLESLEERVLLHGAVHSLPSAEVQTLAKSKTTTISGNFNGQITNSYLVGATAIYIAYQTSGTASKIGMVTFDGSELVGGTGKRTKFTIENGASTLVLSKGSVIVEYSGSQTYHSGKDTFQLTGQVVGGTGIYADATGSLTGNGSIKVSGIKFHLSVKVKD